MQRTLLLAQKFVDQTQAEAEAQARVLVADAEERARRVLGEAEQRAKSVTEDTERHLREEITRLESIRAQLAGDVETIARHMENERNRLRGALSDMLTWVDEHVQPSRVDPGAATGTAPDGPSRATSPPTMSTPRPGEDIPTVAAPDPVGGNPGREPSAMPEGAVGPPSPSRATPPPAGRVPWTPTRPTADSDLKVSWPSTTPASPRPSRPR